MGLRNTPSQYAKNLGYIGIGQFQPALAFWDHRAKGIHCAQAIDRFLMQATCGFGRRCAVTQLWNHILQSLEQRVVLWCGILHIRKSGWIDDNIHGYSRGLDFQYKRFCKRSRTT